MTKTSRKRKKTDSSDPPGEQRGGPTILVLEGLSGASRSVRSAGGLTIEAWPTSIEQSTDTIDGEDWDGLLLTGGGDVDPRLYDQRPRKEVYGVSETRDLVETYALEAARARKVPVLGICRGAQLINVEAGGTLRQHIRGHRGTEHAIRTRNGTVIAGCADRGQRVVSLHHQRVDRVARGYVTSAWATDGTIETIESKNGRVVGVQFHPEMDLVEAYAQKIFSWLVLEAAKRAGLPAPRAAGFPTRSPHPSKFHTVRPKKYRKRRGVTVSWLCPQCGMRFDDARDRDDHVAMLHDDTPRYDDWWVNRLWRETTDEREALKRGNPRKQLTRGTER